MTQNQNGSQSEEQSESQPLSRFWKLVQRAFYDDSLTDIFTARIIDRKIKKLIRTEDRSSLKAHLLKRRLTNERGQRSNLDQELISGIFKYFQDIDSKAGAALTHVSIMITTTVILLFQTESSKFINTIELLFLLVYIISAIMILRSIKITRPNINSEKDNFIESMLDEAIYRRGLYSLSNGIIFYATFLLLIMMVIYGLAYIYTDSCDSSKMQQCAEKTYSVQLGQTR